MRKLSSRYSRHQEMNDGERTVMAIQSAEGKRFDV
jgi:hypothetical protein